MSGHSDVIHTKDSMHVGDGGYDARLKNQLWYRHSTTGKMVPHGTKIVVATRTDGVRSVTYVKVQESSDYTLIGMNIHN